MVNKFHAIIELATAVETTNKDSIIKASKGLSINDIRETLRLLHLFFGFPKILNALSHLDIPEDSKESPEKFSDTQDGEQFFISLHKEHAPKILAHLKKKDALLRDWILHYAYKKVFSRNHFDISLRVRLAILCLAKTDCWKQWESHSRNALSMGISPEQLTNDMEIGKWLSDKQKDKGVRKISKLRKT